MPERQALIDAFSELVRRRPDAVLVQSRDRSATARNVDDLARALERRLPATPAGSAVGIAAPNGPAFLAALIAVLRAERVAVLLDPTGTEREHRRNLKVLGASVLVDCPGGWPGKADVFRERVLEATPGPSACPPGTALVKLSSGSTGAPRGIAVGSDQLLADDDALTRSMGLSADDRLLAAIPFSHSYGLSSLVLPALVRGSTLVLPDEANGQGPWQAAAELGASFFPTVPAYLAALTRLGEVPPLPPTLRLIISAGAPLLAETATRFRRRFGKPVHVFYGASECGGICYDRDGSAAEHGSVGTPVEGVRIELIDEAGRANGAGRVVVRSPAVALGYVPLPDPALGRGSYASEDLAVRDGDRLSLVGRLNNLINVKGRKVNPLEVERVLLELREVDDVCVDAVRRPGSGDDEVRALIACRAASLDVPQVRDWCRNRLAGYKVPRRIVLVDSIPRCSRGKVDRAAVAGLRYERTDEPHA